MRRLVAWSVLGVEQVKQVQAPFLASGPGSRAEYTKMKSRGCRAKVTTGSPARIGVLLLALLIGLLHVAKTFTVRFAVCSVDTVDLA